MILDHCLCELSGGRFCVRLQSAASGSIGEQHEATAPACLEVLLEAAGCTANV